MPGTASTRSSTPSSRATWRAFTSGRRSRTASTKRRRWSAAERRSAPMAAANGVPILWQFRASHFNEKARWALDWKRIGHERRSLLPGPHVPVVLWLTGQRSVPVLQLDGDTVADSTRIIAELERRHPAPPLYPTDAAARRRALELEEYFDDEIGVHVRRAVFHGV